MTSTKTPHSDEILKVIDKNLKWEEAKDTPLWQLLGFDSVEHCVKEIKKKRYL